jgi:phage-related minor tail protein
MVAALIVGGLTAWYLGMRAGIIAAAATAIALVVAGVVPGMTITVYALVIAWSAGVYFLGPKLSKNGVRSSGLFGGVVGQATTWARKIMGKKS